MAKPEERIRWPSYIATPSRLDRAIKNIAEALLACRAEFLFGAGMSKTSGIPQGPDLTRMLLAEFFPVAGSQKLPETRADEIVARYPLEAVAEAVQAEKTRQKLTEKLEEFLVKKLNPDLSAHDAFLKICYWDGKESNVYRVFTTNYDTLLEQAFGGKGKSITYENADEILDVLRGRDPLIPIIHLHGMLSGKYVITESDIFCPDHTRIITEFQNALADADAFVLVGYSMNDPDLRSVYMNYHTQILARDRGRPVEAKTTFVVSPPDGKYDYQIGSEIWNSRGTVWIPDDAATFFRRLSRFLEFESGTKWLDELTTTYDTEDQQLFTQKVDRIANVLCVSQDNAIDFMREARTRSGARR